jgi:hypothetical protein
MKKELKQTIYSYVEMFGDNNLDSVDITMAILSFEEFEQFDVEDVMECLHELVDENKVVRENYSGFKYKYKLVR